MLLLNLGLQNLGLLQGKMLTWTESAISRVGHTKGAHKAAATITHKEDSIFRSREAAAKNLGSRITPLAPKYQPPTNHNSLKRAKHNGVKARPKSTRNRICMSKGLYLDDIFEKQIETA